VKEQENPTQPGPIWAALRQILGGNQLDLNFCPLQPFSVQRDLMGKWGIT